jgi:hypothetical protein
LGLGITEKAPNLKGAQAMSLLFDPKAILNNSDLVGSLKLFGSQAAPLMMPSASMASPKVASSAVCASVLALK